MIEQIINVDRMEHILALFGSFDANIRLIEDEYGVSVLLRGSDMKVSGDAEGVYAATKVIESLFSLLNKGEALTEQNIRYVIGLVNEGQEDEVERLADDVVCITAKGRPLKAKTLGQKKYIEAIRHSTITLGIGPAGTGKTYLAVAMAVNAFRAHEI
ncbi:MAG: PhoH family protein, partial [Oscillospiraceae bacterium]